MKGVAENHARGFSLIEMMATLTLLGLLAMAVLPLAQLSAQRQKEQELFRALMDIRKALDAWKQAVDEGHISKTITRSGYPPSLNALVQGTVDLKSPDGEVLRFLRRVPRDPLAAPDVPGDQTWGLRSYSSDAVRPQPGEDVYDVYSLSPDIGIDGRPYREW